MHIERNRGSTLVEMAIVLLLFLMIIFAVLEFSIVMIRSAQLTEATRAGLRYAIVNSPLAEIPVCTGAGTITTVSCDVDSCPDMIEDMINIAPIIGVQDDSVNVTLDYTCPTSSSILEEDLYLVTVTVSGAKNHLVIPGILGLDVTINLEDFKATRLSEDLHTATE